MDPVTGIGLVASVVQLLTFGIGTVSTIREVYQRGSVSSYDDVQNTTNHLSRLTGSLQHSLRSTHTHSSTLTRDDIDLIDLARKCADCARKLQHELQKLNSQPRNSLLAATRITARAILKKSKIEEISKRLATYQSTLETSLLHRLSHHFDAQSLQNDQRFAGLDQGLQQVVICLTNSQTTLAALTAREADQTRSHITAQIHHLEQFHLEDRLYNEVTRSLFYPDIFSRQEQVGHVFDGIENSYDWIFEEPRTREMGENNKKFDEGKGSLWDDFSVWLKSGQELYWINGKAGSGKSTLMSYICQHSRRLEYLKEWCPDRLLLTPSYFFWAAGSMQQKSIDGFLRSLIYQMLTECRQLVNCLKIERLHAWNESRLLAALLTIVEQTQIPVAVCMILDGLDEIDGRYDTIVRITKNLADHTNVKICLSSRPLLIFEQAFSGALGLRLQDLTYHSIRAYADVQLSDLIQERVLHDKRDGHQAEAILNAIVERANGVFLWAVIAIRDVRDGLHGIADLNELAQTVDSLPSELESLFMLMLNRIKPAYRRDAARYLQIVLHVSIQEGWSFAWLTLCSLHLIRSQRDLEDGPFMYEKVATSELISVCETLRTQLLSHTAGLLELISNAQDHSEIYIRPNNQPLLNMNVTFFHRTARDFLCSNDKARSFLACNGYTMPQVHLAIARGILATIAQFSDEDRSDRSRQDQAFPPRPYYLFSFALRHVSLAERLVGATQSVLMQSLTYTSHVRRNSVRDDTIVGGYGPRVDAYIVDEDGTLIDVVGMAADMGMTLYVCERLGISNTVPLYTPDLPSLIEYYTSRDDRSELRWIQLSETGESHEGVEHDLLRASSYRQSLGRYLRPNSDIARVSSSEERSDSETKSRPRSQWAEHALAETYMLSCCSRDCQDLIRILLHQGANPMAMVAPAISNHYFSLECFWERWVQLLQSLRYDYMKSNGRSGGILLDNTSRNLNLSPKSVFDTTKALLARGADVNISLKSANSVDYKCYLKRRNLRRNLDNYNLDLILDATAMFTLEECFNEESEFRKFAVAIVSFVKRPSRRLVRISGTVRGTYFSGSPSAEDCNLLWPMIEKWEKTGHTTDLQALRSVMQGICEAHRANWGTDVEEDGEEVSEEDPQEDNATSVLSINSGTTESSRSRSQGITANTRLLSQS